MFRDGVIKRMRAKNSRNLPHTAQVLSSEFTEVPSGGLAATDKVLYSLPCRIAPSDVGASPNEHTVADTDQSQKRWWVIFAWDAPELKENQRLIITGQDSPTSPVWTKVVQFLAVMDKRSNRVMTKTLCLERF